MDMEDTFLELRVRQHVSTMLCNKSDETAEMTMSMVATLIYRNFYMDEKSVPSGVEAVEVYRSLRKSLADGGFQLTIWFCNSEKVMERISPGDRSVALSKTFEAEPLTPSILGLQWKVESDSLEICPRYGRRGVCQDHSENCFILRILCA